MTTRADVLRELDKVADTLDAAVLHHTKFNEANAALHMNDKVFYSPLTGALVAARESLDLLRAHVVVLFPDESENGGPG